MLTRTLVLCLTLLLPLNAFADNIRKTESWKRIRVHLDKTPAIDTHDHLWPFEKLPGHLNTKRGRGMNLASLWKNSYYTWYNPLTPWRDNMEFGEWWKQAKDDFDNARSASFYRYQLSAFRDLYGVDFETMTDEEAGKLNRRIFDNYQNPKWLYNVITEKANIELMFNDPYWNRYGFEQTYPWEVIVFNVTPLVYGHHASEFNKDSDSPYVFAKKHGLPMDTLDDYLKTLERLFLEAKDRGAACLKTTLAYQRTLKFENVPKERAAKAFGKRRTVLSKQEIKDFQDFIMWRLCELSAQFELPFQIHTGQARIQGSNPILLVDMIDSYPNTKFILFHGGYPWIGESAVIVQKYAWHVWLDSVWLPLLSYSTAKRAFHEWLDAIPSNRIMWGADCNHAEGIYGSTEFTRRVLSDVLAEKVELGDLREEHAKKIGQQILRDNALELFPQLKDRLWKHTGKKLVPTVKGATE